MTGFAQIMRDITRDLNRRRDRVGLAIMNELVNCANEYLITDVGGYRLSMETGYEREAVERKLAEFQARGWMRVRECVDGEMMKRVTRKMLAPDVIMPVSSKYRDEVLRLWNTVYAENIVNVGTNEISDRQRYRFNDTSNREPNNSQTETQTESQTTSLDQSLEREGQGKNAARHYAKADLEADFTETDAHYSLAETTPVGRNGVARNDLEGKISDISDVQSSAALIERVRSDAPALTANEVQTLLLNHGAETVNRVLDMMHASKKPIQKPAGYIKSMCTRLSGKKKADDFDPLNGQTYLTGKYAHLYNP